MHAAKVCRGADSCNETVLPCVYIGLIRGERHLLCRDTGLFCREIGLFGGGTRLFCGYIRFVVENKGTRNVRDESEMRFMKRRWIQM